MTDTILRWMQNAVSGSSQVAFAVLTLAVNLPIAFLPSSSGHAALLMPILAPPADFANVARSVAVDRVSVGVWPGESGHPDVRGDHGRPRPLQGGLRPLPEVRVAVRRGRLRGLVRIRRRRGRRELNPTSRSRNRGHPLHHHRPRRRLGGRDAAQRDRPPARPRARAPLAHELPRAALRRRHLGAPGAPGVRRLRRPDARARRRRCCCSTSSWPRRWRTPRRASGCCSASCARRTSRRCSPTS